MKEHNHVSCWQGDCKLNASHQAKVARVGHVDSVSCGSSIARRQVPRDCDSTVEGTVQATVVARWACSSQGGLDCVMVHSCRGESSKNDIDTCRRRGECAGRSCRSACNGVW